MTVIQQSPAALAAVPNSGPAWQTPGAALARFTAPAGSLAAVGSLRSHEFARYGVRISGIGLLIAKGTDSELIEQRSVAPIPHSQPWLLGMMNRRGHPIPVFDLRIALDLPAEDGPASPLVLVLGKGDDALGIRVDAPPEALRGMTAAPIPSALPAKLAPFAASAWLLDGQPWVEFDHRAFFTASDAQAH
jgi:chemotaxis signal transduction protein